MTPTAEEVKRYMPQHDSHGAYLRVYGNDVGPVVYAQPCVLASDHDRIVSSLRAENAALELSVAEAGGAFELCDRENERLRAEVERLGKDAARRIELARNEGFREGWMRCGTFHIDVCFDTPDEQAEVDRRLAAMEKPE